MQNLMEKMLDHIAIAGCAVYVLAIIAIIIGGICAGLTRIFISDFFVYSLWIAGSGILVSGSCMFILGMMGWLQFCEYDKQKK